MPISERIQSFYDSILNKPEGDPFTRYKSWEYCYKVFKEYREKRQGGRKLTNNDYDYLALNLAFYLASWGMYRGSSFLLQRDYKTHIPAVKEIMKSKYDALQGFDPFGKNDEKLTTAIGKILELQYTVIRSYQPISEKKVLEESEHADLSNTLVTKIIMGTLACVPAYDRYLKKGLGQSGIVQKFGRKSLCQLFKHVAENHEDFNINIPAKNVEYPIMKKADMYFWQYGYELDFLDEDSFFTKLCDKEEGRETLNQKENNSKNKLIAQLRMFIDCQSSSLSDFKTILEDRNR